VKASLLLIIALALLGIAITAIIADERPDILYADFEGDTYGDWKTTGTAFGNGPARGTLPGQMPVTGFRGKGLVNSFHGGDRSVGTLTSPEFTIARKSITFLIGGGGFAGKTCINLLVGGKVVRTATGPNTQPGGSEELEPAGWDVSDLAGKTAVIEIVDNATGGWGHINIDHIVFTDAKPPLAARANATREIRADARYLFFPEKTGAARRHVAVIVAGKEERIFDIELAGDEAEWWAPLDVSAWKGQTLTVRIDKLAAGSRGLDAIVCGDELPGAADLYREALRPQIHFSPRRGWTNDPNGLVYVNGVYHLFFQHNPYGWSWGNMHWGHAVSKDLVHWVEQGEALYPDAMGPMFSGSAVVDWKNTSGLGVGGKPPIVLFYTAAGNPTVQCLATSTDEGRTFTKYAGNPIVKQISPGNRDPKVLWHEPSQRWVMVLYVETPQKKHAIEFLTSTNLKDWKRESQTEGFYECPDLFELPVDGDAGKKKWVLTAASSEYMVGAFDGQRFTPETPKLKGHSGRGFYAAQTFSDIPAQDGRRLQIGWLQAPSPRMPFNQAMTIPLELNLVSTGDGPRLTWRPARELETLRGMAVKAGPLKLKPGDANPLAAASAELQDVVIEADVGQAKEIAVNVRGVPVVFDAVKQELVVNGHRTAAPLRNGKLDLRIIADRTALEVFCSGGRVYVPMPVIPRADDRSCSVSVKGEAVAFTTLEVHELRSIWGQK
jgi:sucrose-6-phosphate hydrolase SacC (GH32 family)